MAFREITPYELEGNLFKMIAKDWALITAEADGKANAMTISWGGFGQLWERAGGLHLCPPPAVHLWADRSL